MTAMSDLGLVFLNVWARIRLWWHSAGPDPAPEEVPLRLPELADHIARRTPLVKPALDWVEGETFPFRSDDEELFELECSDDRLRTLATRLVFSRHSDRVYGIHTYDLVQFFRQHLRNLFTHGRSFARIYWTSEEQQRGIKEDQAVGLATDQSQHQINGQQDSAGATDTVHHFTGLRSGGIRVRGSPDRPGGYEVDPARAHWWGRPNEWKGKPRYRLQPDQMIALRWPFATFGRNRAPVLAVVPEYWEMTIWMRSSLSSTYAATYSEDKGFRAEAARYRDIASGLERQVWADTRAFRKVGGSLLHSHALAPSLTRPMTTYYEAWQHIEAKKQAVRIRDYILGEFTRQVLSPLALRNGLPPVARLVGKGFDSEADLDGIFARFGRGEISMDEFWQRAQRQTHAIENG